MRFLKPSLNRTVRKELTSYIIPPQLSQLQEVFREKARSEAIHGCVVCAELLPIS